MPSIKTYISGGRAPLRTRCRWVDNIRMDLQEVECGVYRLDCAGPG